MSEYYMFALFHLASGDNRVYSRSFFSDCDDNAIDCAFEHVHELCRNIYFGAYLSYISVVNDSGIELS